MKVYQVTRKVFYNIETKYGKVEVQVADCGVIPETYSSKKKAEARFHEIAEDNGVKNTEIGLFPMLHFEYKWLEYRTVVNLLEIDVY